MAPLREQNADLNQLAAKHIFMAIISKQWGASGYLPKEEVLGEQLRVSRTVVREATKYLAAKSVVETRRRRGTAILDFHLWNLIDREVIDWMNESGQFPNAGGDLLDALKYTQPALAEYVAMQPGPFSGLIDIGERMSLVPDGQRPNLILEFHEQIAILAGNPFMRNLTLNAVEGLRRHHRDVLGGFVASCQTGDYQDAVRAICDGNGERARTTLQTIFFRTPGRLPFDSVYSSLDT
ncbi:hypothetical protein ASD00_27330 [Ensifer sp. Root31]|nr:hypothetical protein ASD00_27330 [Ensifer sp. Root31]